VEPAVLADVFRKAALLDPGVLSVAECSITFEGLERVLSIRLVCIVAGGGLVTITVGQSEGLPDGALVVNGVQVTVGGVPVVVHF
jgi:hypothetical protein